jgi:hypothetical protein
MYQMEEDGWKTFEEIIEQGQNRSISLIHNDKELYP